MCIRFYFHFWYRSGISTFIKSSFFESPVWSTPPGIDSDKTSWWLMHYTSDLGLCYDNHIFSFQRYCFCLVKSLTQNLNYHSGETPIIIGDPCYYRGRWMEMTSLWDCRSTVEVKVWIGLLKDIHLLKVCVLKFGEGAAVNVNGKGNKRLKWMKMNKPRFVESGRPGFAMYWYSCKCFYNFIIK